MAGICWITILIWYQKTLKGYKEGRDGEEWISKERIMKLFPILEEWRYKKKFMGSTMYGLIASTYQKRTS
jgi:hypothetical protein